MDRNAKAKQEFELARQRAAFAKAVSNGQTGLIDRFGAFVRAGDGVLWFPQMTFPAGVVVEVVDAGPNLDLNVRPGTMKLSILLELQLNYPAGQPAMDLLRLNRPATVKGNPLAEADGPAAGDDAGAVQTAEGESDGEREAGEQGAGDDGGTSGGPKIIEP